MKTPKKHLDLLKQNKVTAEALGKVIYAYEKREVEEWEKFEKYLHEVKEKGHKMYMPDLNKAGDLAQKYEDRVDNMLDKLQPTSIQKRTFEPVHYKNVPEYDPSFDYADDELKMYDVTQIGGKEFDVTSKEIVNEMYSRYGNKYKRIKYTVLTNRYYLYYKIGDNEFYKKIYETSFPDEIETSDKVVQERYGKEYNVSIEPYNKDKDLGTDYVLYTCNTDIETYSDQFNKKVYDKFINDELEIIE